MKSHWKRIAALLLCTALLFVLGGCSRIGEKTGNISAIYGIMAVFSFLLLVGYCALVRRKEVWFLLVFLAIPVVNTGYFCLAVSKTLEEALLANRIAYLGSVLLPLSMLMTVLKVANIRLNKWVTVLLAAVSAAVFFIAASPGYLDIYYKEVSLETVNGVAVLRKVYGSWHATNLFYLLFCFGAMIAAIVYAAIKKRLSTFSHVLILAAAVLVNIGIWLLEQCVKLDFEFLSVSYIISELFLIGLHLILQEESRVETAAEPQPARASLAQTAGEGGEEAEPFTDEASGELECRIARFAASLVTLTQTERIIYDRYTAGKTTKEIMGELNITENTLKYHNKNIYSKLEVASRKQLLELAREMQAAGK